MLLYGVSKRRESFQRILNIGSVSQNRLLTPNFPRPFPQIAHSHVWITPKINDYVKSKLSTWHDITYLNMNKRSSWNGLETIRTSVKGVQPNCSQTNYDHIRRYGLSHIDLLSSCWLCVVLNAWTNSKLCGKHIRISLGCNFHHNTVTCNIQKLVLPNHEL